MQSIKNANQRRYQTKQEMVYQTLREAIMRCELAPGQRLVIEDIAHQLDVSHIPVREALQLLQSEHLVANVPHIGATVAAISSDSVIEVFTVMEGLEIVAVRIAATKLTPECTNHIQTILTNMDIAVRQGAHEDWANLNTDFHNSIAQITDMPMLHEMTHRALDQWDRIRRYYFDKVLLHRYEQSQQEHHTIFVALQEQDYPTLEKTVKAHNQGALAAYMKHIESSGS
ncbi:MAG: hypothetical protein GFH27_549303n121 [Chloroflexi bacterium AL-W]|nr:hypothetical protein [Chloroflexi bacterium AL-N1]NOK68006.1 hypothetical protein [Chloroflexi bacterium AL-N10]NOK73346.1 hypothetical protein [Chloroflexi bacterium AL-N5]NOK83260.1 hypothetical protein [Chloroflexi bacterium AL-W]NOK87677.1 hypothetical protein [Chloroflexi bacterium AL-N15]